VLLNFMWRTSREGLKKTKKFLN